MIDPVADTAIPDSSSESSTFDPGQRRLSLLPTSVGSAGRGAAASARESSRRALAHAQAAQERSAEVSVASDSVSGLVPVESLELVSSWDRELICTALLDVARADSEQTAQRAAYRVRLVLGARASFFEGLLEQLVNRAAAYEKLKGRADRAADAETRQGAGPVSIPPISVLPLRPTSRLPARAHDSDACQDYMAAIGGSEPGVRMSSSDAGAGLTGIGPGPDARTERGRVPRRRSRPNVW